MPLEKRVIEYTIVHQDKHTKRNIEYRYCQNPHCKTKHKLRNMFLVCGDCLDKLIKGGKVNPQ